MNIKPDTLNLSHALLHDETDQLLDLLCHGTTMDQTIKDRLITKLRALKEDRKLGLFGALANIVNRQK